MIKYKKFIALTKEKFSPKAYNRIKEALRIAIKESKDLTRYDGSPFSYHAVGVAIIVIEELRMGEISVISSLLHDVVRLGRVSVDEIQKLFGKECAEVLQGMTNISGVEAKKNKEQIEHFKELIVSYSTDPRIILIKLADRLEVMRSLDAFPVDKRSKKSWESLHVYSQLAHKLGLYNIKSELEDLSLRYLEPEEYADISEKLSATAGEREDFIGKFIAPIREQLDKLKVKYTIKGRTKAIYSIWRKIHKQNIPFEEVYDVFAIRIIIDCKPEVEKSLCWQTYSIVTDFYKPNPDRMRDWISIPKSNGYESLHTTVVTNEGKWVEVQIRTRRMDEIAEHGIAAHWRYKGVEDGKVSSEEWLNRLREMMESVEIEGDSLNFGTDLSTGSKEVFVFTPNGDLRKLPEGATVLDFAFDIHSGLGSTCIGGRVNHKNVSIREKLRNGDLVEILTSKGQTPKADWLNFVITSKARSRIKAFLREEEAKMANLGREELERKLKNWKLSINLEEATNILMRYFKFKSGLEVYELIAGEKVPVSDIKEVLVRHLSGDDPLKIYTEERNERKTEKKERPHKNDCLIIDERLRDVEYKLAKCCNPIYGDEIFAFVTVMKGITIHRADCVNGVRLKERFPYRVLNAAWSEDRISGMFSAKVVVQSDDVMGLEHNIRDVLKELKINLRGMKMEYKDGSVNSVLTVEVSSLPMLDSVIYRLLRIKGIHKVYRAAGIV